MRRFNPEKELKKIQHGNRNKIILFVISLLVVGVIGYSFALYQIRYSKRIIYTKVADFSRDVNIMAVFVDNTKVGDFPTKTQGKIYDRIDCDNNEDNHVSAYWDYDKWGLVVETTKKAKCNVYFKTSSDTSGANPPELYQGLIPVTFDSNGNVLVADTTKEWFNYEKKQWANAVLVTNEAYQRIVKEDGTYDTSKSLSLENDILQMYVWIPRYKYQLFNANFGSIEERMINIKFETNTETTGRTKCEIASNGKETCVYDDNGEWYTHPAFTFGGTELTGIWVGKFESGNTINDINVLPNITPIIAQTISVMFNSTRNIEVTSKYNLNSNQIDTHMMKNIEWGVMAYLTQSKYGRCEDGTCEEVTANVTTSFKTGYADDANQWNTQLGMKASTTGNIYGIYDTNGNAWEYVMGNIVDSKGDFYSSEAGFTVVPKSKYYDKYEYATNYNSPQIGHLGDATREILKVLGSGLSGWYGDAAIYPYNTFSWFRRSARTAYAARTGIFAFGSDAGMADTPSFRVVITAQDGVD